MLMLVVALAACGSRPTATDSGPDAKIETEQGVVIDDGLIGDPDLSTVPKGCPAEAREGESCSVASGVDCPGVDHMAFSCGLQLCRCKGGTFACTPYGPTSGEPCAPFAEGASCSLEGQPYCGSGPPASGAYSCKNGKWSYWTSCHDLCPYDYSVDLPGSTCNFEGGCNWPFNSCECKGGKYECI
jgi:hypothetical protein